MYLLDTPHRTHKFQFDLKKNPLGKWSKKYSLGTFDNIQYCIICKSFHGGMIQLYMNIPLIQMCLQNYFLDMAYIEKILICY
jgi:hypothetical protein